MKCRHDIETEWCSLCSAQTKKHGRLGYEIVESSYKGNPVIEILEDGNPFHPRDPHFRFGCGKAILIFDCLDVIHEFAENTDDHGHTTVKPHTLWSRKFGHKIHVSIEPFPEFVHSSGLEIHKPWLKLKALPLEYPHISFGVRKANALWVLRKEIEAWVRRKCK
jgi:hypothetical protein